MRRALRSAGLASAAVAVGVFVSSRRGERLDLDAFAAVNRGHGPAADRAFGALTELGSIWASVGAAAALALSGERRAALRGLGAASAAWLAGQGLKRLFVRPRPYDADPEGTRLLIGRPRATSWPSSHPAVVQAFSMAAASELDLGAGARGALGALAAAVAASRAYLGVHYPGDVLGGLVLGRAVGTALSRPRR